MPRILLIVITLFVSPVFAQNWNADQKAVWQALEAQIAHYSEGEYAQHDAYLHPSIVMWMPEYPVSWRFGDFVMEPGPDLAHQLFPISVVVVGDTAIVNAYWRRARSDGEQTWRLHNTWIREGKQWRLLAFYNTVK